MSRLSVIGGNFSWETMLRSKISDFASSDYLNDEDDLSLIFSLEDAMDEEDGPGSDIRDDRDDPLPERQKTAFHIHNVSRRPSVIKVPRIPKDDVRRKYPLMFLNTLNYMDDQLLVRFFDQFIHPEVVLKRQLMAAHDPTLESQSVTFYGAQEAIRFIIAMSFFGPDLVFKLENCSIITRSTTYRTDIVLDCSFHTYSLYDWNIMDVQEFILRHCQCKDDGSRKGTCFTTFQKQLRRLFPLLSSPRAINSRRRFILSISNAYARDEIDVIQFQIPPF